MYKREESNVMVTVLDTDAICEKLSEEFEDHDVTMYTGLGYVQTSEGVFFLNAEGVGSEEPVTSENPLQVNLYKKTERGIGMFPEWGFNISSTDDLPTKETQVPLHEFIRNYGRTGGSRLHCNYREWLSFFKNVS